MPKFKISVSKNQKKYSIVLNAGTENEAKKKVHSEGYSILNVEAFDDKNIDGHKFYFEAKDKDGFVKKGKVVAKDPFKVYVKLRDGLKYDIKFLYSEDNKAISDGEKINLLKHLEEQYNLYTSHANKNKSSEEKKADIKKEKKNLESFYLKKELEQTYRLLDFILIKIKNILDKAENVDVDNDKKAKLQKLYNSITSLKKSTNVTKLREIGELGLKKIGEIELNILEKYKDDNSRKLLTETNSLLKKIGSKEHFIQKEKDFSYLIKSFFNKIVEELKGGGKNKKEEYEEIDKQSSSYWRTEILISKYDIKKRENTKSILKNITVFIAPFGKNSEKRDELLIRRKIINQNITILKAKKTGKLVSYTKAIKGYNYFIDNMVIFLKIINSYILIIIYAFSSIFILYIFGIKLGIIDSGININGIFAFIYVILGSILIFISRGIISLGFNLALFVFLFIFGVVNFKGTTMNFLLFFISSIFAGIFFIFYKINLGETISLGGTNHFIGISSISGNLFVESTIFLLLGIFLFFLFSSFSIFDMKSSEEENQEAQTKKENILQKANIILFLKNYILYRIFLFIFQCSLYLKVSEFQILVTLYSFLNIVIGALFFITSKAELFRDFIKINTILFSLYYILFYTYSHFFHYSITLTVDVVNTVFILCFFIISVYSDSKVLRRRDSDNALIIYFFLYIFIVFSYYIKALFNFHE